MQFLEKGDNTLSKKTLSAVLAALLLTSPMTAWAFDEPAAVEVTEADQQAAIAKARALLGDYVVDLPYVYAYYSTDAGWPHWSFSFTKIDPNSMTPEQFSTPQDNVSIYLDAKTWSTRYFTQQRVGWKQSTTPPSAEAARKSADAFLESFAPELKLYYQSVSKDLGTGSMIVTYLEGLNGVPQLSSYVTVYVDGHGHVTSFFHAPVSDTSNLPDASKVIPLEEAQKKLSQDFNMKLQYVTQKGNALVYEPSSLPAIDARTGEYVTSPTPWSEPIRVEGEGWQIVAYSTEEAQNIFARLTGRQSNQLTLVDQIAPSVKESSSWTLHWVTPDNPQAGHEAMFDAASYQLYSLTNPTQTPPDAKPVLTLEEGCEKALAYLKHVLPRGENMLFPQTPTDFSIPRPDPKYPGSFYPTHPTMFYPFAESYQGVQIIDRQYGVEVDSVTGELLFLTLPKPQQLNLPDSSQAIPVETVRADYLKAHPLQLIYNRQGQLVYQTDPINPSVRFIDALTGKEVNE